MADKPIKLTDAQLTTLQQVKLSDGILAKLRRMIDTRYSSTNLSRVEFESINTYGFVRMIYRDDNIVSVMLTDLGRAYLLQPPSKTDAARIAELEAALEQIRQIAGSPVVLDFQGLQTELNRIFTIADEVK